MQNNTSKKSKFLLNASLIALLAVTTASASIMIGCGCSLNTSATPDTAVTETKVISETQVVSEVVDVTGGDSEDSSESSNNSSSKNSSNNGSNSNSNSNNNSVSNSSNNSGNSNSSNSNNSNSNNNNNSNNNPNKNSNNNSNNSNNGGNNSNNSSSSNNNNGNNSNNNSGNNNNNNASGTLKIDGKSYNVGDTIICTLSIKTPDLIENFQGQIHYDTKYLECNRARFIGEARGGSVLNFRTNPGTIKFNGSSGVSGYDYTDGGTMMEITYTVKAGGSTTPTTSWEIVRKLSESGSGMNYISNGKPSKGMTSTLSYSK